MALETSYNEPKKSVILTATLHLLRNVQCLSWLHKSCEEKNTTYIICSFPHEWPVAKERKISPLLNINQLWMTIKHQFSETGRINANKKIDWKQKTQWCTQHDLLQVQLTGASGIEKNSCSLQLSINNLCCILHQTTHWVNKLHKLKCSAFCFYMINYYVSVWILWFFSDKIPLYLDHSYKTGHCTSV